MVEIDPLEGIETGPVFFACPGTVSMRPIDPRDGNEWIVIGEAGRVDIQPADPSAPRTVTVPRDEF